MVFSDQNNYLRVRDIFTVCRVLGICSCYACRGVILCLVHRRMKDALGCRECARACACVCVGVAQPFFFFRSGNAKQAENK